MSGPHLRANGRLDTRRESNIPSRDRFEGALALGITVGPGQFQRVCRTVILRSVIAVICSLKLMG